MKHFFISILFFLTVNVFCETVTLTTQGGTRVSGPPISSVPCTITVTFPSGDYGYIDAGLGGIWNAIGGQNPIYLGEEYAYAVNNPDNLLNTYCDTGGLTVTFTIVYENPDDPDDPNNPDDPDDPNNPDDPDDPNNPDDPDDPGDDGGDDPWAREDTLQSVRTLISVIETEVSFIHDNTATLIRDLSSLSSKVSSIDNTVSSISTSVSSIFSAVSSQLSVLQSISNSASRVDQNVNLMKNDLAQIKSDLRELKQSLVSGSVPTSPSRLTTITVTSDPWDRLKAKLLPRYSFFSTISGNPYQTFNFDFNYAPCQAAHVWVTMNFPFPTSGSHFPGLVSAFNNFISFFRTLLLVLMAWCFLKVILKTLRQW